MTQDPPNDPPLFVDSGNVLGGVSPTSGSVAVGMAEVLNSDDYQVAIGYNATTTGFYAIALGRAAEATNQGGTAVGRNTSADYGAAAFGPTASATGSQATAAGYGAAASSSGAVALGDSDANNDYTVAAGEGASASGKNSIAIGGGATTDGAYSSEVAIGSGPTAAGYHAIAAGTNADAADYGVAIGWEASASGNAAAIGQSATATNTQEGILGVDTGTNGPSNWIVPGDFTVNGSKNFEIPDPARPETHDLRHGNYEGDVAGGLLYRREVEVSIPDGEETGTATVEMPEWFGPLASDVDVFLQSQGHFGDAYGDRVGPTTIEVTANESGLYRLLIAATRDDSNVEDSADYRATKPKGETWDGEPRSYYRDAPDVDPAAHDGVTRVEQFFSHSADCHPEPCADAFEKWRVTFDSGERVAVETELIDAPIGDVLDAARSVRDSDAGEGSAE